MSSRVRYHLEWNRMRDGYDVYDVEGLQYDPLSQPKLVGFIAPEALSSLVSKLVIHSTQTHQHISDSMLQLADEIGAQYSDYVSLLGEPRTKRIENLEEYMKETLGEAAKSMVDVFASKLEDRVVKPVESTLTNIREVKRTLPQSFKTEDEPI